MNEQDFLERGKEFAHYLAALQDRLEPDSYALLLRMLRGLNDAIAQGPGGVAIRFSPDERRLLTPELGREFATLAMMLGSYGVQVTVDFDEAAQAAAADAAAAAEQRERDRREVEEIARASGMAP
jgi:hypothetical protein